MASNLPRIPSWAKIAISFLGTLPVIALNGIIGNRADDTLSKISPMINRSITLPLWIAVVVLLMALCPLVITFGHYYKAHQIATKLNKLDEMLLLLLPKLYVLNSDIHESLKRLLEEFLSRTLDLLQLLDGCGIAIYGPDQNDPEYLTIWCQLESPNESKEKARFYIGKDPKKKRGVAGHTFLDKTRRIVHLLRKHGEWHADNHEYVFLVNSNRTRRRLPYRALITVPIIGDANDSLGVLCLYSESVSAFDSVAVQNILIAIAGRLSAAMLVARTYQLQPTSTI